MKTITVALFEISTIYRIFSLCWSFIDLIMSSFIELLIMKGKKCHRFAEQSRSVWRGHTLAKANVPSRHFKTIQYKIVWVFSLGNAPTPLLNLMKIGLVVFEYSCEQTDKETNGNENITSSASEIPVNTSWSQDYYTISCKLCLNPCLFHSPPQLLMSLSSISSVSSTSLTCSTRSLTVTLVLLRIL